MRPAVRPAPSFSNFGSSASASGRGSSMAWQRCRPDRSLRSTADRKIPWSISSPLFSPCRQSSSAAICCALGTRPGTTSAACVTRCSTRTKRDAPAVSAVVDRHRHGAQEPARDGARRLLDEAAPPPARRSLRCALRGSRSSRRVGLLPIAEKALAIRGESRRCAVAPACRQDFTSLCAQPGRRKRRQAAVFRADVIRKTPSQRILHVQFVGFRRRRAMA